VPGRGATYVSPFLGRLDDIGHEGMDLVRDIAEIFAIHGISTEIIAASIRHPLHVIEAAKAGSDIATVPYKVMVQMTKHPLTDNGIERFMADWQLSRRSRLKGPLAPCLTPRLIQSALMKLAANTRLVTRRVLEQLFP